MTEAEFTAWLVCSIPEHAAEKVIAGLWTQEESAERSRAEHEKLLPLGLSSKGNHFFCIVGPDGESVGMLWFEEQAKFGQPIAYVYKVEVASGHQRKGHARKAFVELERKIEAMGLHGIALHVYGHNSGARSLYASLGFVPTNIHMFKHVSGGA
ncbi:GNAT family N-acetyltransferase [Dokdonella sp.]|uniref:GNAT family N-acetyltransferase n=1 Tax=Dokdonella sp. TaxID=2291710 RepID=UPI003C687AF3